MECSGGTQAGTVRVNGQSEERFREAVSQSEAGTLTSTSSGDERWYDFMDQPPSSSDNSPPPLPTRIGSKPGPVSSAFQTPVNSGRRSTNERPRRSPADQSETSVKSSPDPASVYQVPVTKYSGSRAYNGYEVASTNQEPVFRSRDQGGPINGYESASSSDTVKSSSTVHIPGPEARPERRLTNEKPRRSPADQSEASVKEARSTYLTDYELNNNRQSSVETEVTVKTETSNSNENYLVHNRLAALKTSPVQQQQQHVTYSNVIEAEREERLVSVQSVRSEDELSGVSSHSPIRPRAGGRGRNNTGATTPSSTGTSAGSRGHSPRTVTSEVTGGHPGVKKKVARSARNSANLAGSSLQEDLMRLISPEYNQETGAEAGKTQAQATASVQDSPLSKLPKKTLSELSLMKSRSRENIARLEVSEDNFT